MTGVGMVVRGPAAGQPRRRSTPAALAAALLAPSAGQPWPTAPDMGLRSEENKVAMSLRLVACLLKAKESSLNPLRPGSPSGELHECLRDCVFQVGELLPASGFPRQCRKSCCGGAPPAC